MGVCRILSSPFDYLNGVKLDKKSSKDAIFPPALSHWDSQKWSVTQKNIFFHSHE